MCNLKESATLNEVEGLILDNDFVLVYFTGSSDQAYKIQILS